jgi:hypothetical protein
MEEIGKRIERIKNRIYDASRKVGRDPEDVEILGATKDISVDLINEAARAGIRLFGENRVQEAQRKIPQILYDVEWHMIGHLQRNKVKKALELFHTIESVDSLRLALEINKRAKDRVNILIEVNTSGEPQKYGVSPKNLDELVERILDLENLNLLGLMTLGPYPPEEKRSRGAFKLLRTLRDGIESKFKIELPLLSMGMTEDFEWAVMEGATIVRIGRGIFGERER